ncbi:exopolysaccharide biosynthesis protein [Accumulibacter sp.]|uniref:exopolysaccharide biosynthesis protein n=1 Tax=Accumulibacter sp. TaxID=2053492 RepID=UPI002628E68A|nr:exopolysaccharide biosynthesis protein [Accumulibacter sp.]
MAPDEPTPVHSGGADRHLRFFRKDESPLPTVRFNQQPILRAIVADQKNHPPFKPASVKDKRRATLERIASQPMTSLEGTLAQAIGQSHRQRLVWLGLLAMPLLFPVALPGMASAVGAFSLLIAYGLFIDRPAPLPDWLANREMHGRASALLKSMISRVIKIIVVLGRPRMLPLSNTPFRILNGLMLAVAGLSMMMPVPIITFDNVLPALAIVLISWGLRLRDGLMLVAGYLVTVIAVISVIFLWWGGAVVATELISLSGFGESMPLQSSSR